MEPWHHDDRATIYNGDCLEVLRALPDASVDAVVTDPPYGLEFMGKEWDSFGDTRQPGDENFTPGSGPFGRAKVRHGPWRSVAAASRMASGTSAKDA